MARWKWFQYFNKPIKLGFAEDVVFQKMTEDFISSFGRDVTESVTEKMFKIIDMLI